MKYHELNASSNRTRKRVGRGIAAGGGKTAGRGTKGQSARTGGKRRPGFEGGQNPLTQRLPKKKGFKSLKTPKQVVYTGQLDNLKSKTVDITTLVNAKLITNPYEGVKLVVKGELKSAVKVSLQGASATAVQMLEKAGGSFEQVPAPKREKQTKK